MRRIFTALFSLLVATNVLATMQRPDRFIYEGKEYRTNSRECPYPQFYMEAYFKQHPEKRPKSGLMSTALYRRYVATYEITESQLALNDIRIRTGYDPDKWESFRDTIVTGDSALIIDWFTGVIVLHPFDELIDDKRRTSLSLNEGDIETILLQIEDGNLTCVRKFAVGEYKKFQERQLTAFKKTDKYEQAVRERLERGTEPAHVDIVINNFLMFYSGRILVTDDQSAQNDPTSFAPRHNLLECRMKALFVTPPSSFLSLSSSSVVGLAAIPIGSCSETY